MPGKIAPMLAEAGDAAIRPRRLDVGAEARRLSRARVHRRARRQAALAARARSRVRSFRARGRARPAGGERDDPRRRDRRIRRDRRTLLRRAAGSRPVEDGAGDRGRRQGHADRLLLLRSPVFRGRRSARLAVSGPPPLPRAMPAALAARAARACDGRRPRAAGGGARERVRRRRRQAQGQPLRDRPALDVVGQGQADAKRGLRHRRLHAGQGLAHLARRDPRRLLGRRHAARQAPFRVARRLGLRRTHARRRSRRALRACTTGDLSVRRGARAERTDDVGRASASSPR